MTVEPGVATTVVGLIVLAIPTLIGWLVIRAVNGVDTTLKSLRKKIDELITQDTQTKVALADLRARVVHLEVLVLGKAMKP